mmetsp:Transcript_45541/g.146165  ORF Transcript_45541/g.146165 Transcript_45541/m.146165 type:complete len:306 (-) Transcript_45541:136-1053(-)
MPWKCASSCTQASYRSSACRSTLPAPAALARSFGHPSSSCPCAGRFTRCLRASCHSHSGSMRLSTSTRNCNLLRPDAFRDRRSARALALRGHPPRSDQPSGRGSERDLGLCEPGRHNKLPGCLNGVASALTVPIGEKNDLHGRPVQDHTRPNWCRIGFAVSSHRLHGEGGSPEDSLRVVHVCPQCRHAFVAGLALHPWLCWLGWRWFSPGGARLHPARGTVSHGSHREAREVLLVPWPAPPAGRSVRIIDVVIRPGAGRQAPGSLISLKLSKPKYLWYFREGMYGFLCMPEYSKFQYHPFTICSG